MKKKQLITVKVNEELGLLLDKVRKDYSINVSNLVRRLLLNELKSDKYIKEEN